MAIEQQRATLEAQVQQQVESEKARLIAKFHDNMGEILSHYILEVIGNEIDLTDQLDYIFASLEENKQAIVDDLKSGS